MNQKNYNNLVTVIIVTYHSDEIVDKLLLSIEKNIKVLVIENSLNIQLKENLEKKFSNVQVIIPEKNLGNGGGINLGFKNVKTTYALYLDVDTMPSKNMIDILLKKTEELKNFSILAPKVKDYKYKNEDFLDLKTKKNFHKMKFITGCGLLFSMEAVNKIGNFDENIFLYFEEIDFYHRSLKLGMDIYMIDDAELIHYGSAAINKDFNQEILVNRSWHYCWSKFYYFKKNFGYFYGLKKTLPNFFKALTQYIFFKLKSNKTQSNLHAAEISGLLSSYILRKSYRRPKIK